MGRIARFLIRLSPFVVSGAWLADRWLRGRAGGVPPAPIRTSIEVEAPIERVWRSVADLEGQPAWMHDLRSVELLTPGPVRVGTRAVGRVQAYGISVSDPIEVIAFEPPTRYAIRHAGLFGGEGEIRLASTGAGAGAGAGTVVTWDESLVAPLLPHLGAFVLALVFRPIFQADLDRLAEQVERDEPAM